MEDIRCNASEKKGDFCFLLSLAVYNLNSQRLPPSKLSTLKLKYILRSVSVRKSSRKTKTERDEPMRRKLGKKSSSSSSSSSRRSSSRVIVKVVIGPIVIEW